MLKAVEGERWKQVKLTCKEFKRVTLCEISERSWRVSLRASAEHSWHFNFPLPLNAPLLEVSVTGTVHTVSLLKSSEKSLKLKLWFKKKCEKSGTKFWTVCPLISMGEKCWKTDVQKSDWRHRCHQRAVHLKSEWGVYVKVSQSRWWTKKASRILKIRFKY